MITHGYNARDLRISSILSIPKDIKSSLTSSDNYRGISLFNSICKVFDYTILDLCNDYFMTCCLVFKINIQLLCAFDHVHYGKLFYFILLYKKVPFVINQFFIRRLH